MASRPPAGEDSSGSVFPKGNDVPAGPGHYTMIREGFSTDPAPPPTAGRPGKAGRPGEPTAKPASMPSRRSRMWTVLGLVAVLLTIVALVLVFALTG